MKQTLIRGEHITKSFFGGKEGQDVLKDVSLELYEGDFTVIMGASGAGKSTLLYVLSGMERADSGRILYREQELGRLSEKQMAGLRAEDFGFVFQQAHLVSNLTLRENIAVAALASGTVKKNGAGRTRRKKGAGDVWRQADELLLQMGIADVKDHLPKEVSGGEAQRAAIARAAVKKPALLFADEPTGALNQTSSREVLDLIGSFHEAGQSVLMVTHDIRAAVRANRILYLEDGNVLDELRLEPYRKDEERSREETVNKWLTGLRW